VVSIELPPRAIGGSLSGLVERALRKRHAQALLEHGQTSVPTVAQRLGHSSEKVTLMLYLRSTSEMDEAAAGAAEEVFGPQPARDAGRVETRKGRPPRV
jgi:integrase